MKVGDVINDYTIIRYIDNGSFGKVWEVRKDGKSYALKTCSSIEATDIKRFEREIITRKLKKYGTSGAAKDTIAKELGLSRATLYRKLSELEIMS